MIQIRVLVRQASALVIGNLTTRPRDAGVPAKNDTRYSRAIWLDDIGELWDMAVSCSRRLLQS